MHASPSDRITPPIPRQTWQWQTLAEGNQCAHQVVIQLLCAGHSISSTLVIAEHKLVISEGTNDVFVITAIKVLVNSPCCRFISIMVDVIPDFASICLQSFQQELLISTALARISGALWNECMDLHIQEKGCCILMA